MERIRLNKYLAQCGVCSRRDADKLIEAGKVVIDGQVAKMGQQVDGSEEILVNGSKVTQKEKTVVLLYHKPVGVVCTEKDPHEKRTLATEIKYPLRVTYAGRLDKDSRGLLLLTNDGDLIEEMMRGANAHEKEYLVRVNRPVDHVFLEKMAEGVYLSDLDVTTRPCKLQKVDEKSFRIILTQGLNRQIRRMCEALGYQVRDLKRERVVNLELGDLKEGAYREASEGEIQKLRDALAAGKQKR